MTSYELFQLERFGNILPPSGEENEEVDMLIEWMEREAEKQLIEHEEKY